MLVVSPLLQHMKTSLFHRVVAEIDKMMRRALSLPSYSLSLDLASYYSTVLQYALMKLVDLIGCCRERQDHGHGSHHANTVMRQAIELAIIHPKQW